MINLSFGEYTALVAKALRGAGYSWGLTEDASFAARRLAEFGYPSAKWILQLLDDVESNQKVSSITSLMPTAQWQPVEDFLCPICVGAAVADTGGFAELAVGDTAVPVLTAPLLAATLDPGDPVAYVLDWQGGSCTATAMWVAVAGEIPNDPVPFTIRQVEPPIDAPTRVPRVEVDAPTMHELERYAHRVYAPATEASRRTGAGE